MEEVLHVAEALSVNARVQNVAAGTLLAPVESADGGDELTRSLRILASIYYYNHWVFDAVRPYLGRHIVEVGGGIGNITQFLLNAGELVCLEPFPRYAAYLRERFAAHANVRVHESGIEACPNECVPAGQFDSVVCLNVLEHIADDRAVMARFAALLAPGGRAIVLVPALPVLFGAMDRAMGHLRRYTRASLANLARGEGLTVERCWYMNALGALGWWWRGRVRGHHAIPERETRLFDRAVPLLAALEGLCPPPLGQSVVLVARRAA